VVSSHFHFLDAHSAASARQEFSCCLSNGTSRGQNNIRGYLNLHPGLQSNFFPLRRQSSPMFISVVFACVVRKRG
jgi:hypothetical protein